MGNANFSEMQKYLSKWQAVLRLEDWDIKLQPVVTDWRKTGDIKIDVCDKVAVLLINTFNPKQTNIEAVIIHELLHMKLYGMDMMLENTLNALYKKDNNPKRKAACNNFMVLLEQTVNDLTKSFLALGGDNKEISFGRLKEDIEKEIGF